MLKAEIRRCNNLRMTGRELRRLRIAAGVSEERIACAIGVKRRDVRDMQDRGHKEFELPAIVMQRLLTLLGVRSL